MDACGRRWLAVVSLLCTGVGSAVAASAESVEETSVEAQRLLRAAYDQRRVVSMKVTMSMRLVDGGREWKRSALLFIERRNDADDHQLFKFTAPPDLADSAVLTREQQDGEDEQWVYLPAYHMVRRIPPANRGDAYLGTDYFYEDVLDLRWSDYRFHEVGRENVGEFDCVKIEAIPVAARLVASTVYSRTVYWVEPRRKVIPRQEFFDKQGKLLKVLQNSALKTYGRYQLWDRSVMENTQNRHKTITEVERREVDVPLPDDLFTQKSLKRG